VAVIQKKFVSEEATSGAFLAARPCFYVTSHSVQLQIGAKKKNLQLTLQTTIFNAINSKFGAFLAQNNLPQEQQ